SQPRACSSPSAGSVTSSDMGAPVRQEEDRGTDPHRPAEPATRLILDQGCSSYRSQTLTVPSQDALARRLPSGLKHTPPTRSMYPSRSMCPWRVRIASPVRASHTFTVPSSQAVAIRLPSGLKQTPAAEVCPVA